MSYKVGDYVHVAYDTDGPVLGEVVEVAAPEGVRRPATSVRRVPPGYVTEFTGYVVDTRLFPAFAPGTRVRLTDPGDAAAGAEGVVVDVDKDRWKYLVRFPDGEELLVLPRGLSPVLRKVGDTIWFRFARGQEDAHKGTIVAVDVSRQGGMTYRVGLGQSGRSGFWWVDDALVCADPDPAVGEKPEPVPPPTPAPGSFWHVNTGTFCFLSATDGTATLVTSNGRLDTCPVEQLTTPAEAMHVTAFLVKLVNGR